MTLFLGDLVHRDTVSRRLGTYDTYTEPQL